MQEGLVSNNALSLTYLVAHIDDQLLPADNTWTLALSSPSRCS